MTRLMPYFFTRKSEIKDYSSIGFDLHSHVIHGIDDGPDTLEKSVHLLKSLHNLGFERCILTPHVSENYYPNSTQTILDGFDTLNSAKEGVPEHYIHSVAAEYMLDDDFLNKVKAHSLLTLPGNRVLFELPFTGAPLISENVVFALKTRKYVPVLAHPERYGYWADNDHLLRKFINMGCELQVNILSLLGYYGSPVRKAAYSIIEEFKVDFLATDCHNEHQAQTLREGLKDRYLANVLNRNRFSNLSLLEEYG